MRASELLARLGQRVLLLDGGFGSMLIAAGLEPGRAPEWWTLERPERVEAVHRAYCEAGSDIVHANTFGASPPKLAAASLAGRCREINVRAIEIARRTCGGRALVAGDIGPTGLLLPPVGTAGEDELRAAFEEQVAALAGGDAELLSIETMYDLREALAAVRAARQTGLAVLASMTFEARKRGAFTIMGDPLERSLQALLEAGADAVGCNCSVTPEVMVGMVKEARAAVAAPLIAQPNAGQPRATLDGVVYDASPAEFARQLMAMVAAGARLVGGCCGTDPEFIRQARRALDEAGA
ncbi:MAG: homocysteine S-methyltransferase family protein [Acidobacteriota bacterium]